MNYTQLQARATLLASFEGWTDSSPSPVWGDLVNQAYQQYCWDTECTIGFEDVTTVKDQAEYAFTGNFKEITDCYYDTASAKTPLIKTSWRFERQLCPGWYYAASGVPSRFMFMATNTLRLAPAPATAALTVRALGVKMPAALSEGSDTPPFPSVFHEAIALYAAWIQGKTFSAQDRRDKMLAEYDAFVAKHKKHLAPMRNRRATRNVDQMFSARVEL